MPVVAESPVPAACLPPADGCGVAAACVLGIDEAGRGPLLGPMVYGAAYWPFAEEQAIAAYGFDDSKALTAARREALFRRMADCGRIGWVTHSCTAREISAEMLRRSPVSLNVISHDAAMSMLDCILARGVRVEKVFVDTVGEPGYYQSKLEKVFNSGAGGGGGTTRRGWAIDFVVSKKADSLYKCVSAASIAAKVTRDAAIRDWVFEEPALAHVLTRSGAEAALAVAASSSAAAAAAAAEAATEAEADVAAVRSSSGTGAATKKVLARGGRPVVDDSDSEAAAAGAVEEGDAARHDWDEDDDELEEPDAAPAPGNASAPAAAPASTSSSSSSTSSSSAPSAPPATTATAAKRRRVGEAAAGPVLAPSLHPYTAGSGYPGDPLTKAWAKQYLDPVFGWPSVVRFSWAPAKDALEREGVKVAWLEEEDVGSGAGAGAGGGPTQAKLSSFFSASSSTATGGGASGRKCAWLRKRRIEPLAAGAL